MKTRWLEKLPETQTVILWLQFIAGTNLIEYAGTKLIVYGDITAEKTGSSKTRIGLTLLASYTINVGPWRGTRQSS